LRSGVWFRSTARCRRPRSGLRVCGMRVSRAGSAAWSRGVWRRGGRVIRARRWPSIPRDHTSRAARATLANVKVRRRNGDDRVGAPSSPRIARLTRLARGRRSSAPCHRADPAGAHRARPARTDQAPAQCPGQAATCSPLPHAPEGRALRRTGELSIRWCLAVALRAAPPAQPTRACGIGCCVRRVLTRVCGHRWWRSPI
jgi:hypothetical protein